MATQHLDSAWPLSAFNTRPTTAQKIGPTEFDRLWHGFMTARATLGLVLLLLQTGLWLMGQNSNLPLILVSFAYFLAAAAGRLLDKPRLLGSHFNWRWISTIGLDLLAFSVLQWLQGGGINYAPLVALPVLQASVLGTLFLAMGTAAVASLLLLVHAAWLTLYGNVDITSQFVQAALIGAGCFVIALLANQVSSRLEQEEQRARLNQRAAQAQRRVNELVIESLTDGILVVDAKGWVRSANPAARKMLGAQVPPIGNALNLNADPSLGALADLAQQSFVRNDRQRHNVTILRSGRNLRRLEVGTQLAGREDDSADNLCVMFLQDQREIKARMRTEKLASMGRMSVAVAHEIRNPLAAIAQANDLLDEDVGDPKHRQLIRLIAQNATRLGKIVDEVLHLSHVQGNDNNTSSPKVNLTSHVDQICQDWSAQTGTDVTVDNRAGNAEIPALFEPEHLRRVMINLLDNAKRYASSRPAAIQVKSSTPAADFGSSTFTETSLGTAEVRVWSDGAPMDPSVEQHLFEPFFSSESRSSGLGLYICRELCDGHGATIHYQRSSRIIANHEIEGNEFVVRLRISSGATVTSPQTLA